jgi:ATP-binding cassette subfamily C (CFTR/MRP) protein 1
VLRLAYAAKANGTPPPNIGRGVGMALGLWALTILQSVCQHQFFFRSMAIGVLARATLISAIYKRSLSLTVGSRSKHPNGKLINHISSDVSDIIWHPLMEQISRIDYCAQCEDQPFHHADS